LGIIRNDWEILSIWGLLRIKSINSAFIFEILGSIGKYRPNKRKLLDFHFDILGRKGNKEGIIGLKPRSEEVFTCIHRLIMPDKSKLMLKKSENEEDEIILGIFLNYLTKNNLMKWGVENPALQIFFSRT
jgi:hypothetical protein